MRTEVQVSARLGQIEGALMAGDAYSALRDAGKTAHDVWAEQQREYQRTGLLPSVKATLDAMELAAINQGLAIAKNPKVAAKLAPKPAPAPTAAKPPPASTTITNSTNGTATPIKAKLSERQAMAERLKKFPLFSPKPGRWWTESPRSSTGGSARSRLGVCASHSKRAP